jgi:small multidrug resistance pump
MSWSYAYLLVAIVFEVIGTSALAASQGFTRALPSALAVAGYALAFFFLALPLRTIPVGIVYAIWSGAGIVLITAVAWIAFGQALDPPALIGIALIMAGVLVINLFSGSLPH